MMAFYPAQVPVWLKHVAKCSFSVLFFYILLLLYCKLTASKILQIVSQFCVFSVVQLKVKVIVDQFNQFNVEG